MSSTATADHPQEWMPPREPFKIRWLEDEPLDSLEHEARAFRVDRWTNVRGPGYDAARPFALYFDEVFRYDPAATPLLRTVIERYAPPVQIETTAGNWTRVTGLTRWEAIKARPRMWAVAAAKAVLRRLAPWELDDDW